MKYLLIILFFGCAKIDMHVSQLPEICDTQYSYNLTKRPFDPNTQSMIRRAYGMIDLSKTKNVLLLDFDGHTVSNTSWNYNGDFTCAPSGLTAAEIQVVVDTIQKYFASFNILVTTNEGLYNLAQRKQRIVFTESWEWYGKVGGVAYTNSFKWNNNTPAFVFSSLLGYHTRNIALAGLHESGHTLGLRHQADWKECVLLSIYKKGAIMGIMYNLPGGWIRGKTPYSCESDQNDIEIIKQTLG